MKTRKIHFIYNPDREMESRFADRFISVYGHVSTGEAELFIAVGGDGTILHALRESLAHGNKPVAGIKPTGSNSVAYLGNTGINSPEDIEKLFNRERSQWIPIAPLECTVYYGRGSRRSVHAFNDITIIRTTHHACYLDVRITRAGSTATQFIKGDGLIVSTALGSTGINHSYGGPRLAPEQGGIILTGMGIYHPARKRLMPWSGFRPQVFGEDTVVQIDVAYGEQFYGSTIGRPVRVDFDTGSLLPEPDGSAIEKVLVRKATDRAVSLIKLRNNHLSGRAMRWSPPLLHRRHDAPK